MELVIHNLVKAYGKIQALSQVNLTISPGIHGLLGPNGAGKTTLMRILATILNPDRGEIYWGDELTWQQPRAIKKKLGYLPQNFSMYKYLRVNEALRNVALLKDLTQANTKEQIARAVERANLKDFYTRKVGHLSGGMLRRLGLAQAILGEPDLLILDEPSAGLDPAEQIHFRKLIRDYTNGERIILLSSHIVRDLESLCDEVSVMNNGNVLMSNQTRIIQASAGHYVREEMISQADLHQLEQTNTIIDFAPVDACYRVRYLTNEKMPELNVTPSLEDSYIFIMQGVKFS